MLEYSPFHLGTSSQSESFGEREVEFDGAILPDHIPNLLGGSRAGVAYSIAYMRALVQAVNNEYSA